MRVEEAAFQLLPAPLEPSDVMLDPWTDLPAPQSIAVLQAMPGPPVLPDFLSFRRTRSCDLSASIAGSSR